MKYFDKERPPLCLHVLGQDLVNHMHEEGCAEIQSLIKQRDLLLAALKQCKAAAEDSNRPPSARLELVRDHATWLIVASEGGAHE